MASARAGQSVDEKSIEEIRTIEIQRHGYEPAVHVVDQEVLFSSETENRGRLRIDLTRPVYNFTASGHLDPNFRMSPNLRIKLVQHPSGLPQHRLGAGSGTTFDFNVHIKSGEYKIFLPAGEYLFEYEATAQEERVATEVVNVLAHDSEGDRRD